MTTRTSLANVVDLHVHVHRIGRPDAAVDRDPEAAPGHRADVPAPGVDEDDLESDIGRHEPTLAHLRPHRYPTDDTAAAPTTARDNAVLVGLLTTAELAKELSVSVRTVQRWVDRGWVRPELVLPSGQYRFDLDSVKRQLRDQR